MSDTKEGVFPPGEIRRDLPEAEAGDLVPWPLRIYTLGRFSVVRDGVPLKFERKAQKRPIELLQILIALGGRQVRQFHLEDAIWPNAPMESAQKSFNVALYRLRKLIGPECLSLREGKLTLDSQRCWVDVWAFERQLGEIENGLANETLRPGELSCKVARAMALCQGSFLSFETEQGWMVPLQEKLRHRVWRLFKEAGRYLGREGQCQQAIALYHRALEIDPVAEEFYRRLIICYAALGCRAEALATYYSCRKILQSRLQVPPSPLTDAVMKTIRLQERSMNTPSCDTCRRTG